MIDAPVMTRYMRNPDVVLREEDQDGGLLFNPDTNQIRVLNATGLCLWQLCDGTRDLAGLVAGLSQEFDAVPGDRVETDTRGFIDEMVGSGFIGTLEEQAG